MSACTRGRVRRKGHRRNKTRPCQPATSSCWAGTVVTGKLTSSAELRLQVTVGLVFGILCLKYPAASQVNVSPGCVDSKQAREETSAVYIMEVIVIYKRLTLLD